MTNTITVAAVPEMPHALFDQYVLELSSRPACGLNQDLASEVKERLLQLAYILSRVVQVEQFDKSEFLRLKPERERIAREQGQAGSAMVVTGSMRGGSEVMDALVRRAIQTTTEIRTLTEAFYYFAFRIFCITRAGYLPLLKGFKCDGVRNVRNHLIEHPESTDFSVFAQSISYDNPQGPVLKFHRPRGQEGVSCDNGLYPNASEFATNLTRVLQAAIIQVRESAPRNHS